MEVLHPGQKKGSWRKHYVSQAAQKTEDYLLPSIRSGGIGRGLPTALKSRPFLVD